MNCEMCNNERNTRISVALVTCNRPLLLERALRSLLTGSSRPFEIVISDDSAECSRSMNAKIASDFGCRYVTGPRRGLYANRNYVALQCTGTHVRTMDDDHQFPEKHWDAVERAVNRNPRAVWIIGEYWTSQEKRLPPACPPELSPSGHGRVVRDPSDCWAISDGASVFPREIFDKGIRYFDGFPYGQAYLEFGARLYSRSFKSSLLPETYVVHDNEPGLRGADRYEVEYASAIFAALSFSFIHFPKTANKIRTVAHIVKYLSFAPINGQMPLQKGMHAFLTHYRQLKKLTA